MTIAKILRKNAFIALAAIAVVTACTAFSVNATASTHPPPRQNAGAQISLVHTPQLEHAATRVTMNLHYTDPVSEVTTLRDRDLGAQGYFAYGVPKVEDCSASYVTTNGEPRPAPSGAEANQIAKRSIKKARDATIGSIATATDRAFPGTDFDSMITVNPRKTTDGIGADSIARGRHGIGLINGTAMARDGTRIAAALNGLVVDEATANKIALSKATARSSTVTEAKRFTPHL